MNIGVCSEVISIDVDRYVAIDVDIVWCRVHNCASHVFDLQYTVGITLYIYSVCLALC